MAKITLARNPVKRKSPFAGMLLNGQGRVIDLGRPAPTLPATMGGNRTPIIDQDQLDYDFQPWIVKYHQRIVTEGREPLKRLPKSARLRRLTVEEAATIQTFPRDLDWQGPQSAKFRRIGNAVHLLGWLGMWPPLSGGHSKPGSDQLKIELTFALNPNCLSNQFPQRVQESLHGQLTHRRR